MAPSRRFERLTNLLLVLLDTPRPLSLREIGTTVAGYPSDHDALRQAFERDKRTLRDGGIPVAVERIDGEEQVGYRIIPEQYYLPDLDLEDAEREALAFALAAVRIEGGIGPEVLAKLGSPGLFELAPVVVLPSLPALGPLHAAVRTRSLLRFGYHGREREVEPYCLVFRSGSWYLYGLDRTVGEGGAPRTFRVDRIDGTPVAGDPGTFEVPAGFDPGTVFASMPFSADAADAHATEVEIEADAREVAALRALLGPGATVTPMPSGAARFAFGVADESAFVPWILGFGDSVRVRAPASLRGAVIAALERAAAVAGPAPGPEGPGDHAPRQPESPGVAAGPGESGAPDAGTRLRRLLAILAHLAQVGQASVEELARRFGMSERALVAELELAACCGRPPYTPDELLELVVDDERVVAHGLDALRRPPKLTAEEGFAVAAAARGLLAVAGVDAAGPLSSALAKLESVLGADQLRVEVATPPEVAALRRVAAEGGLVEIDYLGAHRGGESTRTVVPYRVVVREGHWYLDAYCLDIAEWRRFAAERVAAVRATDGAGAATRLPALPPAFDGPRAFVPGPLALRALVAVPEGRDALLDKVSDGPATRAPDGRTVVPLLVGDRHWLGRLVLALGGGAEVLEPAKLRGAPAEAAAAALARYAGARRRPRPSARR